MRQPKTLCSLILVFVLSIFTSACRSGGSTKPHGAAKARADDATGIVTCSEFVSALSSSSIEWPFRKLVQDSSSTYKNSATGQSIRFLAVQPGNVSSAGNETLIFFTGTSQILPDWPVDMLINGSDSLCDDNALVFFDYPGIGDTTFPEESDFTYDNISNNVYNLLADLNTTGSFKIASVNPVGWSLGTEASLKFATLAAGNESFVKSGMTINNLFLIATKSGGDYYSPVASEPEMCSSLSATPVRITGSTGTTYYTATGNQGMCVTSIMDQLLGFEQGWDKTTGLKKSLVGTMFPYVYSSDTSKSQGAYGSGDPTTVCAATIPVGNLVVSALCDLEDEESIETSCDADSSSVCAETFDLYKANREEKPYFEQISYDAFHGERALTFHYDYGYCETDSTTEWLSTNCHFNPNQTSSSLYNPALVVNGSPCITVQSTSASSSPTIQSCPGLTNAAFNGVRFYIFNGQEDLFIRYDYGEVFCNWLSSNNYPCTLATFPDAGHGVLYSQPGEIYSKIEAALSSAQ